MPGLITTIRYIKSNFPAIVEHSPSPLGGNIDSQVFFSPPQSHDWNRIFFNGMRVWGSGFYFYLVLMIVVCMRWEAAIWWMAQHGYRAGCIRLMSMGFCAPKSSPNKQPAPLQWANVYTHTHTLSDLHVYDTIIPLGKLVSLSPWHFRYFLQDCAGLLVFLLLLECVAELNSDGCCANWLGGSASLLFPFHRGKKMPQSVLLLFIYLVCLGNWVNALIVSVKSFRITSCCRK